MLGSQSQALTAENLITAFPLKRLHNKHPIFIYRLYIRKRAVSKHVAKLQDVILTLNQPIFDSHIIE